MAESDPPKSDIVSKDELEVMKKTFQKLGVKPDAKSPEQFEKWMLSFANGGATSKKGNKHGWELFCYLNRHILTDYAKCLTELDRKA